MTEIKDDIVGLLGKGEDHIEQEVSYFQYVYVNM